MKAMLRHRFFLLKCTKFVLNFYKILFKFVTLIINKIKKMKKLFIITMSLVAFTLQAQTEQGSWVVEGGADLSFSSVKQAENDYFNEVTTSSFSFNPAVSYFVIDNLSVGLGLEFGSTTMKMDGFDDSESSTFAIMPEATYFFGSGNTRPYAGLSLGMMSVSNGDEDADKASGFGWGLEAGAAIFLSDSVSLNLGLGYSSATLKNKEVDEVEQELSGLGLAVGFSIFL